MGKRLTLCVIAFISLLFASCASKRTNIQVEAESVVETKKTMLYDDIVAAINEGWHSESVSGRKTESESFTYIIYDTAAVNENGEQLKVIEIKYERKAETETETLVVDSVKSELNDTISYRETEDTHIEQNIETKSTVTRYSNRGVLYVLLVVVFLLAILYKIKIK